MRWLKVAFVTLVIAMGVGALIVGTYFLGIITAAGVGIFLLYLLITEWFRDPNG